MTINRSINEILVLTIGSIVSDISLVFTKTATSQVKTIIPTVNSSTLRYLNLTVDTLDLNAGEYILDVVSNVTIVKSIKVEVEDYTEQKEYDTYKIYDEYNG